MNLELGMHAQIQKFLSEGVQLGQVFFIVDKGREDPSTTISGPLLARQRNTICWCADDDPTLNAGFVCNFSGDPDLYC